MPATRRSSSSIGLLSSAAFSRVAAGQRPAADGQRDRRVHAQHAEPRPGDRVCDCALTAVSEFSAISMGMNWPTEFWTESPSGSRMSGSTNRIPTTAEIAAAVFLTMAPRPRAMSAIRPGYAPAISTARSTPGWPSVACGAGDRSASSPAANAANARTSPATSVTAASTAALAASTAPARHRGERGADHARGELGGDDERRRGRRGPAGRGPARRSRRCGSKTARSGRTRGPAPWLNTKTARPIMPAAKTSRIHHVERTLRSFSHSILVAERKPYRASASVTLRVSVAAVITGSPGRRGCWRSTRRFGEREERLFEGVAAAESSATVVCASRRPRPMTTRRSAVARPR